MKRTPLAASFLLRQKGAVMPMVGFIIIVMLALAALAVDIGYILVTKQQLQNAADACALAAAPALILEEPEKTAEVQSRATDMASRHRAGNDASVTLDLDKDIVIQDNRVTVYARKLKERGNGLPLFFARIFGVQYADVFAKATAEMTPSSLACCVKPWAMPDRWHDEKLIPGYPKWQNNGYWDGEEFTDLDGDGLRGPDEPFVDSNSDNTYNGEEYDEGFVAENPPAGQIGVEYTLKVNSKNERPSSSFFNPVVIPWLPEDEVGLPPQGANRYYESIVGCKSSPISPGERTVIESEPGNMVGPTDKAVNAIIADDPDAHWDDVVNNVVHDSDGGAVGESPRIVLMPVYDPRIPPRAGRTTVVITKVVAFFIEDVKSGNITGRMTRAPSNCPQGSTPGPDPSFIHSIRLVE